MPANVHTAAADGRPGSIQVLLGLFDGYMRPQRDQLTSETKIGGTAMFFPPLTAEHKKQVDQWSCCGVCGHPMSLLLQAYSPLPNAPAGAPHHRMVYVMVCNSSSCTRQPLSSMVTFSVQVDAEDTQALAEEEEEEEEGPLEAPLPPADLPSHALPPCYVYITDEPATEVVVPTDVEQELIKMAEENCASTVPEEELRLLEQKVDLKDKRTDYLYEKFRSRVARAPTQVLRYYQRPPVPSSIASTNTGNGKASGATASRTKGARPIFMNPDKVRSMVTIPACPSCGAAQTAELQVMPTALYYLEVAQYTTLARTGKANAPATDSNTQKSASAVDRTATVRDGWNAAHVTSAPGNVDDGCDFGTITVYVCSKDCAARQSGVVLRRETLCVEEAPTMKDEERAEAAAAAEGTCSAVDRRQTFAELLHGTNEMNEGAAGAGRVAGDEGLEDEDEEEEEAGPRMT